MAIRIATAAFTALGAALGEAAAADLRISGFFSERLDVRSAGGSSEDRAGTSDDDEAELRSRTSIGLNFQLLTETLSVRLAPGVTGSLSSAADADPEFNFRFSSALSYTAARSSISASLSVIPDFVDETQFEETGVVDRSVLQISTNGQIGFTRQLNPRTSLSLGASARQRTFTEDTESLSESRSFGLNASLGRAIATETSFSFSPSLRYFQTDDDNNSEGYTASFTVGGDHQVNSRLRVGGSLGPAVTVSRQDDRSDETQITAVGGLNLSYGLGNVRYGLNLTQDVDQDSDGELRAQTRLRGNVSRAVNSVSSIGLNVSLGLQTPLFGSEDNRQTVSISPNYSYDLSEAWSLGTGYRFRASNDDEFEDSHLVFLELSRGLALLP